MNDLVGIIEDDTLSGIIQDSTMTAILSDSITVFTFTVINGGNASSDYTIVITG
jgi:hypothetical protein